MLDIDDVVLGGETDLIDGPFAQAAEDLINERLMSEFRDAVTLRPSQLNADATLLGAVALVLRTSLGLR
jgi:predicted NBD/HSP70 family sugar kinase